LPGSVNHFLKIFPSALPVPTEDELIKNIISHKSGVYYFTDRSWLYFSVSGICPNLNQEMNCNVHNSNYYLAACRNMTPESEECAKSQLAFKKNLQFCGR